jgi:hypothetical protein
MDPGSTELLYAPSLRGKNNLYKLFVCRALELTSQRGRVGFITPMAILGDDQAAALRRLIFDLGAFTSVETFPQKDVPGRRVFPEAKLSTAAFTILKSSNLEDKQRRFQARVHPGRFIVKTSPSLLLSTAEIPLYDPDNLSIVSCDQADWDLVVRIVSSGRMERLRNYVEFFQGEVNQTNERQRGTLCGPMDNGRLVIRGASICSYVHRPASQGDDLWINVQSFLEGRGDDTKAFHHRFRRVALQETSPQNNFRRIIAAMIPRGEFFNHKVNYTTDRHSRIPLEVVAALLNSKFADWYFRLGSTNAAVSHYQLYNLPCPEFATTEVSNAESLEHLALLDSLGVSGVIQRVQSGLLQPPFAASVRQLIVETVRTIVQNETNRGGISRAQRSELGTESTALQQLLDELFYRMAGISDVESRGLETRLASML